MLFADARRRLSKIKKMTADHVIIDDEVEPHMMRKFSLKHVTPPLYIEQGAEAPDWHHVSHCKPCQAIYHERGRHECKGPYCRVENCPEPAKALPVAAQSTPPPASE
jgi:hypothetical protein